MLISSNISVMVTTNNADKRQLCICLGHGKLTFQREQCRDVSAACNAGIPSGLLPSNSLWVYAPLLFWCTGVILNPWCVLLDQIIIDIIKKKAKSSDWKQKQKPSSQQSFPAFDIGEHLGGLCRNSWWSSCNSLWYTKNKQKTPLL